MDDIYSRIATAAPGSTLTLPPGTHTTSAVIDKSLVLKGSQPGTTLIAAAAGDPVLTIRAQRVIVSDLAIHQSVEGSAAVRIDGDAYPQFRRVQVTGGSILGKCSLVECSAPSPIAAAAMKREPLRVPTNLGLFAVIVTILFVATGALAWLFDSKPQAPVVPASTVTTSNPVEASARRPIPVLAEIPGYYSCTHYRQGIPRSFALVLQPAENGTVSFRFDEAELPRGTTSYDARNGRLYFGDLGSGSATIENGKVIIRADSKDDRNSWHFDRVASLNSSADTTGHV